MNIFINKSQGFKEDNVIELNHHYERVVEEIYPDNDFLIEYVDDENYGNLILIKVI